MFSCLCSCQVVSGSPWLRQCLLAYTSVALLVLTARVRQWQPGQFTSYWRHPEKPFTFSANHRALLRLPAVFRQRGGLGVSRNCQGNLLRAQAASVSVGSGSQSVPSVGSPSPSSPPPCLSLKPLPPCPLRPPAPSSAELRLPDVFVQDMRIAWEEPFGPVIPVIRVKSIDDAIDHCNSNNLALQVWPH